MKIHLARHYGMCFGVREALRTTHSAAALSSSPVTVLGQLVHNPVVSESLVQLGVRQGSLRDLTTAVTKRVVITAHGASSKDIDAWQQSGHDVIDTTCPLVRKAHQALELLVHEGYLPVVIGESQHAEVQGLVGDFPQAIVLSDWHQIASLPQHPRLGVISQTTQPLDKVLQLIDAIKHQCPDSVVRFIDTICRPTKERQRALHELCETCDVIVVVGGKNSNNTRQLTEKAIELGCRVHQIERPDELQSEWFKNAAEVGVTAGTSTLDETVQAVMTRLHVMNEM